MIPVFQIGPYPPLCESCHICRFVIPIMGDTCHILPIRMVFGILLVYLSHFRAFVSLILPI